VLICGEETRKGREKKGKGGKGTERPPSPTTRRGRRGKERGGRRINFSVPSLREREKRGK